MPRGIHHDQLAAALGELLEEGRRDRVVLDRVGPDDDAHVRVFDLVKGRGHRAEPTFSISAATEMRGTSRVQ